MIIRKARPEEAAMIAPLILLAMEDIAYSFIGERSKEKALWFLEGLVSEANNQYSYEHCWVMASGNTIAAAAIVYNGDDLATLREPVARKINQMFDRPFNPGDETQAGEYYIDTVGVDPGQQGKGIGSEIFRFLIAEYVERNRQTLGLLVDKDNPGAKKLYLNLGFEVVGEKVFAGKEMEHLQYKSHT